MSTAIVDVNSVSAGAECQCGTHKEPEGAGVLVVSASIKDHVILADLFQTISCRQHWTISAAQAIERLRSGPIGVIVCNEQLGTRVGDLFWKLRRRIRIRPCSS